MGNKKLADRNNLNCNIRKKRTVIDSKQLKKASGSYEFNPNSNSTYEEVYKMSEYIERKEFEQFEKKDRR